MELGINVLDILMRGLGQDVLLPAFMSAQMIMGIRKM